MELVRGQRLKLDALTSDPSFTLSISVAGLDAAELRFMGLLLDQNDAVVDARAVVLERNPSSACGSIALKERGAGWQSFSVDLRRLPSSVARISFAMAIHAPNRAVPLHADVIREGHVQLEAGGRPVARWTFRGSDFGKEAALQLVDVYKKDVWRLAVVGSGYVGGLPAMLSRYQLSLDAAPPGPALGGGGFDGPLPVPAPVAEATRIRTPREWAGRQVPPFPTGLIRSVGLVVVDLHDGRTATGTGFMIGPGGHFLTCRHVVEDATRVSIALDGTHVLRPVEVLQSDPDFDLALCWIADREGATDWLLLAGPDSTPELGCELGLLGYPLGFDLGHSVTYSQGIINSLRRKGELNVLQIDAGAAPGSSGGPVFRRRDGHVVGMLTSGINLEGRGMLINFAIDMRALWRLGWLAT